MIIGILITSVFVLALIVANTRSNVLKLSDLVANLALHTTKFATSVKDRQDFHEQLFRGVATKEELKKLKDDISQ